MVRSRSTGWRWLTVSTFAVGAINLGSPAFEDERIGAPLKGERVTGGLEFYIAAEGRPLDGELYRIEVGADAKFEKIVTVYDMAKSRSGWMIGDPKGIEDVPEELIPKNYSGIHLRVLKPLADGEYYWRAAKSTDGLSWQPIDGGTDRFIVDTHPPAAVDTLRLKRLADGSIQLWWAPVVESSDLNPETVRGYRLYRYDRPLKRYPTLTKFLMKEVAEETSITLPIKSDDSARITFYRVQAVDEVGNEEGRQRPAPIGSMEAAFNPPNADQLTDPKYLGELYRQAREKEDRKKD